MSRKNTVLNGQARKLVYHVHCFMQKEAKEGVSNLKQVQKRTAEATNTSVATVRRIMKESREDGFMSTFRTPGKKRPRAKPVTGVNDFEQGVIRRCIHNFHITENELPTVEKLRKKLQQDINFQGSERSLRRIIEILGFKWKNTEINRPVLIETSNIRLKRIEYLKRMSRYRHEGRPIVYTGESYIDSSHSTPAASSDDSTNSIKKPISKRERVVIVHAASETGFIPNALLTFIAGIKTADYHDNMNLENYEKWLRTQLIPNLPRNSVVVVDNAYYHNKHAPTSNAKISELQEWLTEKGLEYSEDMLKPQLYDLIKSNKGKHKKFRIGKILSEYNHDVIQLPPYHKDLNPIEMAFVEIKGYVSRKSVTWNIKGVTELIKEYVELMGASEWSELCEKVRNFEEEYKRSDRVVDALTEELIIQNEDSDGDSHTDGDDDDYDDDDEMPTAVTSCFVKCELMEDDAP